MRAAVVEKLNEPMEIRSVADPVCPADGAILRVQANGICRTDWALWAGNFWTGGPQLSLPFVLGHEFAGTIEEVGADVRGWKIGDRVTFPMRDRVSCAEPGNSRCASTSTPWCLGCRTGVPSPNTSPSATPTSISSRSLTH